MFFVKFEMKIQVSRINHFWYQFSSRQEHCSIPADRYRVFPCISYPQWLSPLLSFFEQIQQQDTFFYGFRISVKNFIWICPNDPRNPTLERSSFWQGLPSSFGPSAAPSSKQSKSTYSLSSLKLQACSHGSQHFMCFPTKKSQVQQLDTAMACHGMGHERWTKNGPPALAKVREGWTALAPLQGWLWKYPLLNIAGKSPNLNGGF